MKLTKQQAIEGHRKMWNWIADEIEKRKRVCIIIDLKMQYCEDNDLTLKNGCFCCEYDDMNYGCVKCPLDWGKGKYCSTDKYSLYTRVAYADTWQEQAGLARQIANLPEKEEEKG